LLNGIKWCLNEKSLIPLSRQKIFVKAIKYYPYEGKYNVIIYLIQG